MASNVPSNSTRTILAENQSYFGLWASTATYNGISVLANSDEAGTLYIQLSTNKTVVDYEYFAVVEPDQTQTLEAVVNAPFFRVKYVNGADAQTSFLIWSSLTQSYPTEVAVNVDLDAETSSIAVWGQKPDESLSPLQLDASGNLKTTATLSVEGTLNVSDETTHELLGDVSGAIWENTDRLLYDLDIIANHGDDASANALALITAVETQTTDLSNALTAVVNGLHDISGSVSVSNFPATQDISGSVSVSNQITGFATSAKQDSILSDLDQIVNRLHDVCGNVVVSNQITGFATESTLEEVATTAEDISLQLFVPQRSWVEVDFDTQSSQVVQGSGTWRVPLTGEEGWEYVNSTIGGATAYFYSNTGLVAGGLESDITLGSLTTMWFIGNYRLATEVNPNRRFYLSVYTKPQGAGDFQPWYRSSKTYQLPNSAIISKGADVFYYAGIDIGSIYKEYNHTAYELAVSRGPCVDDEIIQFMSLAVDSATPANEFDGIIKHAGFMSGTAGVRVVSFTRASREKIAEDNLKSLTVQSGELKVKDASAVALLAEIANGITVEVGEVDISGASFTENKLNVFDASANSELTTIREIIGDTLLTVNYGLLNDTPTYAPIRCDASGALLVKVNNETSPSEVDISGASFTENKLNVFDASAVALLGEIANGITVQVGQVEISGVVITEISGVPVVEISGNVDCNVSFPIVQMVEVSGVPVVEISGNVDCNVSFPTVQMVEVSGVPVVEVSGAVLTDLSGATFTDSKLNVFDASSNEHLFAIEDILETGFVNVYDASCELVLEEIKTQTDKLTFVDIDENTNNLKVIDFALNQQLSQFSFITDESEITDLRTRVMGSVEVINSGEGSLSVSESNPITGFALETTLQDVYSRLHDVSGTIAINNFPATQTVEISGVPVVEISGNVLVSDLSVNVLNSFLDVHCFGSSDGTTFHHIKTNPNGVVATNAIMETDDNGALTSTAVSGTETYNALHTIVKGSVSVSGISNAVSVQNETATQLAVKAQQYGSYGNVANNLVSLLPSGTTAGINVADWSYIVGAYEDYNGATVGTISLEYSFDNITYYTLFNTQIFPSGSSPRRTNINKQDIPAVNWIRLRNGTSSTLTSITLTLLGGSLS
jgi:ABC-type transporter Mla MlaB component